LILNGPVKRSGYGPPGAVIGLVAAA
jgi:hypothetical protein